MGCNTRASWCINRFLMDEGSLKCQCIIIWENVEAYTSHIILYMLHVTTKPYSSRNGEIVHIDSPLIHVRVHSIVFYSNHCFMWLSSYALRCETGRWGTSDESSQLCVLCPKQVPDSLNDDLPFITFHYVFDTSFMKPNPCTNYTHNHIVHSRLWWHLAMGSISAQTKPNG